MLLLWLASSSRTAHGAQTARRAPLTVQLCRASISPRARASSRKRLTEAAQQAADVGAADLAGEQERFDDAVGHRVGELCRPAVRRLALNEPLAR